MPSSRVPRAASALRAAVALAVGVAVVGVAVSPAFAQRLRSPASSLVLATPTVTCGASPQVNLSWSDSAPSATGDYRVMSNTIGGKANAWSAGPYLGDVRSTSVGAANGSGWQFAIHAVTSVTRDSNVVSITINCPAVDGTAPSIPTITSATATSCSSVALAWTAVTDTGGSGLAGYNVFRDGSFVQRVPAPATSWTNTALAASTLYSYRVSAIDNAGNQSAQSAATSVSTPACVNQAPHANAGADQSVLTLVSVSFNGSGSTDSDGSIASYGWNFGDGTTGTGVTASHVYASAGVYTATLTVTDNQGATGSDTAVITVANRPPTANAGADQSGTTGTAIAFNGSGSSDPDGTLTSYAWSFGDGTTGTGVTTSHTYAAAGTFTVTLTVTDNKGATASDAAIATIGSIANQPPVAKAGADQSALTLVSLSFSGAGSSDPDGSIASYGWNFGDGSTATGVTAAHTYASSGVYTVTLTVTDNKGATASDTAIATITNRPPLASAGPDQTVLSLVNVNLTGSASSDPDGSIVSYAWSFGDGSTASGVSVGHTYATPGSYTATVTVTDNNGATATDSATITVQNRPPVANAGADQSVVAGTAVTLSGGGSDVDGSIVGYVWNFGDGTTGSGASVTHTYASAATYTATLTVTDNKGATASDTATITVTAVSSPVWARAMIGAGWDTGTAVAVDGGGNSYIAGAFTGAITIGTASFTAKSSGDAYLAKVSPTGTVLWARQFGSAPAGNVDISGVAVDASGRVSISGWFYNSVDFGSGSPLVSAGMSDIVFAQFDAAGAFRWAKRFGGSLDDQAAGITVDTAGELFTTGFYEGTVSLGGATFSSPFGSDADLFVAKYDAAGSHVWSTHFTNTGNDQGTGVAVDAAGDVAVSGGFTNQFVVGSSTYFSSGAVSDGIVFKLDPTGAPMWSRRFMSVQGTVFSTDLALGVAFDRAGDVLAVGQSLGTIDFGNGAVAGLGGQDGFVAKYAGATGAYLWAQVVGGTSNDHANAVATDASNNVIVGGYFFGTATFGTTTYNAPAGTPDGFVVKYSAGGATTWSQRVISVGSDSITAVATATNGDVSVTGYYYQSASFDGQGLTGGTDGDAFIGHLGP